MKHKGSISQTYLTRDAQILPMLYRQACEIAEWPTTMRQLCCLAASLPTPFFCIADDAALHYVRRRLFHGVVKSFRSPFKQRLYDAFWREFHAIYLGHPDISLQDCVWRALALPAPCVGLTPWVIQFKISHHNSSNT
jgi:hypothetical protein